MNKTPFRIAFPKNSPPIPPLLRREGAKHYPPSLREEKGLGDELNFLTIILIPFTDPLVLPIQNLQRYDALKKKLFLVCR